VEGEHEEPADGERGTRRTKEGRERRPVPTSPSSLSGKWVNPCFMTIPNLGQNAYPGQFGIHRVHISSDDPHNPKPEIPQTSILARCRDLRLPHVQAHHVNSGGSPPKQLALAAHPLAPRSSHPLLNPFPSTADNYSSRKSSRHPTRSSSINAMQICVPRRNF